MSFIPTDPRREPRSNGPHPSGDGNLEGTAEGPSRKQRRRKSGPMTPGRFSGGQQSNAGRGVENGAHHSDEEWCALLFPASRKEVRSASPSPTSIHQRFRGLTSKTRAKLRAAINRPQADLVKLNEFAAHLIAFDVCGRDEPSVELKQQLSRLNASIWRFLNELQRTQDALVPPPEERLCKIHGIPVAPSRWLSGHKHSDCSRCRNAHDSKRRNTRFRHARKSNARRMLYGTNRLRSAQILERYPDAASMGLDEAIRRSR
jgi:hypothetical protein